MKVMDSNKLIDRLFSREEINDWDGLVKFYNDKFRNAQQRDWGQWIFRGDRDSERPLMTSIERLAIEKWKRKYNDLPTIERGLIRAFTRRYHQYSQFMPNEDDNIQWLSIMQHYGTVTRLLDCTYSFYVALLLPLEKLLHLIIGLQYGHLILNGFMKELEINLLIVKEKNIVMIILAR